MILRYLKKDYNITENDFVLLFMGRLYDFTGLLEIANYYNDLVQTKSLKLKFLILGVGEVYSKLKEFINKESADWIILTGLIPYIELANYIELADLCLQSFKRNDITKEVMPIKVLEYMAMKKPVLSTKLPGMYNQIGENNGVLFVKDQDTLIRKIKN